MFRKIIPKNIILVPVWTNSINTSLMIKQCLLRNGGPETKNNKRDLRNFVTVSG